MGEGGNEVGGEKVNFDVALVMHHVVCVTCILSNGWRAGRSGILSSCEGEGARSDGGARGNGAAGRGWLQTCNSGVCIRFVFFRRKRECVSCACRDGRPCPWLPKISV